MTGTFSSRFDFAFGSFLEFFSALYPFLLLGGVLPLMDVLMRLEILTPQSVLVNGIAILLLAILGILCLIGLAKGLPRWSLPYLGFLISIFSVYQFPAWLDRWWIRTFPSLYDRSWFLGQVAYQGMLWVGLSVVALLLVLLIVSIPLLRRFKKDWTLLLLLLYGSSPFALLLTFDDYVNEGPYELLAFLVLGTGLWLYLHTQNPRRQFWALFGGLTVSLFIAAIAKAIIYQYFWEGVQHFTWLTEMMSTIIMWMWIALGMLVPLMLKLFARSKDRLQAT